MISTDIPNHIRETARDLFVKMQDDDISLEELQTLEQWLDKDPMHRAAYQEYAHTWHSLEALGKDQLANELKSSVESLHVDGVLGRVTNVFQHYQWAIAACFIFVVVSMFLLYPKATPISYISEQSEIKRIELPDGSLVTLSADSHIQYFESRKFRNVTLVSGEAFFDVKKDSARPFVVLANEISVRVVGTQFNINIGAEKTEVGVVEGVVAVEDINEKGATPPITLTKGEGVVKQKGQLIEQEKDKNIDEIAPWKAGRLSYKGVPLKEILHDVNRYYPGKIELADKGLEYEKISASFSIDNIENVPDILCELLPLKPYYGENGVVVLVKK